MNVTGGSSLRPSLVIDRTIQSREENTGRVAPFVVLDACGELRAGDRRAEEALDELAGIGGRDDQPGIYLFSIFQLDPSGALVRDQNAGDRCAGPHLSPAVR